MFLNSIRAEQIKLRHSPVWLAFFILPLLPAIMGTFNYLQNISILEDEWYSLWSQQTLFSCYFFLPAQIAVYCSYLLRLEHGNHNWNATLTAPVSYGSIFFSKFFMASVMVLLTQIWIGLLFVISGKLIGLPGAVPLDILRCLVFGIWGGMVISALQLCISLVIPSFAVPVAISLMGGIAGLAAFAKGYGAWFPYSLLSLGMNANSSGDSMLIGAGQFILNSTLFLLIFCLAGVFYLHKKDLAAG